MKKNLRHTLIMFSLTFGLFMSINGCGGDNNQNLADALGGASDSLTSGIVCWIIGCDDNN